MWFSKWVLMPLGIILLSFVIGGIASFIFAGQLDIALFAENSTDLQSDESSSLLKGGLMVGAVVAAVWLIAYFIGELNK